MTTEAAFEWAKQNDVTVATMLKSQRPLEEIIVVLCEQKAAMFARMMALESIAPRRVHMPDGTFMVWHCPDELIPVTTILS